MGVANTEEETQAVMKVYSKEDYSIVNRFESIYLCIKYSFSFLYVVHEVDCAKTYLFLLPLGHGGGWGYSAHSVEAIRFCADTDILLGGLGLFGGRGEYTAKIKVRKSLFWIMFKSELRI